jgi:hypothetical protein
MNRNGFNYLDAMDCAHVNVMMVPVEEERSRSVTLQLVTMLGYCQSM